MLPIGPETSVLDCFVSAGGLPRCHLPPPAVRSLTLRSQIVKLLQVMRCLPKGSVRDLQVQGVLRWSSWDVKRLPDGCEVRGTTSRCRGNCQGFRSWSPGRRVCSITDVCRMESGIWNPELKKILLVTGSEIWEFGIQDSRNSFRDWIQRFWNLESRKKDSVRDSTVGVQTVFLLQRRR